MIQIGPLHIYRVNINAFKLLRREIFALNFKNVFQKGLWGEVQSRKSCIHLYAALVIRTNHDLGSFRVQLRKLEW